MASCSAGSSSAAAPTSPKPAQLTTKAGSAPSVASRSAMRCPTSRSVRSNGSVIGRASAVAAISSASVSSCGSGSATSASSCPCAANTRASAAPIPEDAPVMRTIGRAVMTLTLVTIAGRLFAGNAATDLDAVARRHVEQVGGAPHQIVLELIEAAVGVNDLPHHLDDPPVAVVVEPVIEAAGEMVEVDGFVLGRGRLVDKLERGGIVEVEAALEHRLQLVAFGRAHLAVDGRGVHQQRCGREPIVVLRKTRRMLGAAGQIGEKIFQAFEHAPHACCCIGAPMACRCAQVQARVMPPG